MRHEIQTEQRAAVPVLCCGQVLAQLGNVQAQRLITGLAAFERLLMGFRLTLDLAQLRV